MSPACSGSLLAELVAQKRCNKDAAFAWQHPRCVELPPKLRELLDHAQNFSEVMHGAPLLYNLILGEQARRDESAKYRRDFGGWLCRFPNVLTRCWDTVVALDGELTDRSKAIAANHPLADFVAALPGLARLPLPRERRQGIAKISDELRRVRFTGPDGFDENQCRFWVAGLDGKTVGPFGRRRDKAMIVSPFISNPVVRDFLEHTSETHLVSRLESLQELPQETLQRCRNVKFLAPDLVDESDEEAQTGNDDVLDGLHAKLFVIDHGWDASIFSGSFNPTVHALNHNVEFMVELVGKKSQCGVDAFLRQEKAETNFADLLQAYDVNAPSVPADATLQKLDDLLQAMKQALAAAGPRLIVTSAGEQDLFDLNLEWERAPRWPDAKAEIRKWPITQPANEVKHSANQSRFPGYLTGD